MRRLPGARECPRACELWGGSSVWLWVKEEGKKNYKTEESDSRQDFELDTLWGSERTPGHSRNHLWGEEGEIKREGEREGGKFGHLSAKH